MVVAADAKLADEIVCDDQRAAYDAYLVETRKSSDIDRMATDRAKTGVFLGASAINPVNGEQVPVWAADYVLADYGTGAIMAVPGQDQRDWDFAEKFDLPIVRTVQPPEGFEADGGKAFTGARTRDQLRQRDRLAGRHGGRRGQAHDHQLPGGAGDRPRRGELSACVTGCCPASASGAARSR